MNELLRVSLMLLMALALTLAGCTSTSTQRAYTEEVGEEEAPDTAGLEEAEEMQIDPLSDPDSPLAMRVVYFDFDKSTVKPEYLDAVAAHGSYLAQNPGTRMRLEGHADERGSREYNLGLGERRSQSMQRLMSLQGISDGQAELISYGEEKPAALGHDESAWSQNRRVEIVYE